MKKLHILCMWLLTLSVSAFAQNGTLKGHIFDENGETMPGATIMLNDNHMLSTATDFNGFYLINSVPAGEYNVRVRFIGYQEINKTIKIESAKTSEMNFTLTLGIQLQDVVVNARLAGESKALNAQRNNLNITNIVSNEQLERFPDGNIGDAMKRITGINVQYDQGEARFGNIRGTAPELNSVTINGERIPSAEAEIRSVQLDLVSSDMIETVEFSKALTPDMDADAIGGSINLVTKQAPYKKTLTASIGSRYNFVANKPSFKGKVTYGDRYFNGKLGVVLSASLNDNKLGSDNLEAEWKYIDNNNNGTYNDGDFIHPSDIQVRQYYLERLRQSYALSFDYKFNDNHVIYLNNFYNKREDWENRYRFRMKKIKSNGDGTYAANLIRQTKFGTKDNKYSRLEDQKMMNFGLGGKHEMGSVKLDWLASYSKANEERPEERYIQYETDTDISLDLNEMSRPRFTILNDIYNDLNNNWTLDELSEEYQYTEEVDKNFRLNVLFPVVKEGDFSNKVKTGLRYRGKQKMRDNWLKEFSPLDENEFSEIVFNNTEDISKSNFMAGNYPIGHFISRKISNNLDLYNASMFSNEFVKEEEAGDFNASEDIAAAYIMMTQHIKDKLTIIAGVRTEQTNLKYQGYQFDVDNDQLTQTETIKDSYINVMPGIHFNYTPSLMSNLRFAWTNTIARPNYYDLVPYREINRDDSEIKEGNPNLLPTTAMNFDLGYEYFFGTIGVASIGTFYKNLQNVISWEVKRDYELNGNIYNEYRKPNNIADANLFGFEMAFSRRLDFLPSVFKKLTFYANYTYAKSKLKNITLKGREDADLSLNGSPEHTYNLSLAYDSKKLDLRVSFNHASAFLNANNDGGIGTEAFYDFYYDAVNHLDFNTDYKINKQWSVYLHANNLLNQPLRTFWGAKERIAQDEFYGIKFQVGAKFKL